VVEDKITDTLNKVRLDKNFQNPILRLGKTGSTYNQILSSSSMEDIKTHYKAVKNDYQNIENSISTSSVSLKKYIEHEIQAYKKIKIKEILEYKMLDIFISKLKLPINIDESLNRIESINEIRNVYSIMKELRTNFINFNYDINPTLEISQYTLDKIKFSIEYIENLKIDLTDTDDTIFKNILLSIYENNIDIELEEKTINNIEEIFNKLISYDSIYNLFSIIKPDNFSGIKNVLTTLSFFVEFLESLNSEFGNKLLNIYFEAKFTDMNYKQLNWFIESYKKIRMPVFGYLFNNRELKEYNNQFKKIFNSSVKNPHKYLKKLENIYDILLYVDRNKNKINDYLKGLDFIFILYSILNNNLLKSQFESMIKDLYNFKYAIDDIENRKWFMILKPNTIREIKDIKKMNNIIISYRKYKKYNIPIYNSVIKSVDIFIDNKYISKELESLKNCLNFAEKFNKEKDKIRQLLFLLNLYPETFKKININKEKFISLFSNSFIDINDNDFNQFLRYIELYHKIKNNFLNIPNFKYNDLKKNIEFLVTTQMTFLMDRLVINFYEYNKSTAKVLREIIKSKQKFPKEEFLKLKNAFPCILSGIRDYAEYIPLEPDIFDLVIIDEASQVSIAQAFPALLRAKKILVLGDKKQFSNVKTSHARTDTNIEYMKNLNDCFVKHISNKKTEIIKLDKFNIKTSILDFFEYISNYHTQLLKHFRGYKEIISYSNKFFYQNSLQVMKIRGRRIEDVIKFTFIKYENKKELIPNTNSIEADYILSELKKLKDSNSNLSIGIITPHTNQQKLIVELINKSPDKNFYFDTLKLKIMTFDTCQGEERDVIFYSLVANNESDHLWGVFIKNLDSVDLEEDGKIKAQRLNVGFSRAKETIHFILSKNIDDYKGAIGEAIRYYYSILNEAKMEKSIIETDKNSKMEPEVLNWFYQTEFWEKNKNSIEFMPQFEIGRYLKQLDKSYNHPKYKVDFLLIYKDKNDREHKIIIEYDGFNEHFQEIDNINKYNYHHYYNESDIYRQKVLESYDYKFLRINKFNIGENPILKLNERLNNLIENDQENFIMNNIYENIENLYNGEKKECPKCGKIRSIKEFQDYSLKNGVGRICRYCKLYNFHILNDNYNNFDS